MGDVFKMAAELLGIPLRMVCKCSWQVRWASGFAGKAVRRATRPNKPVKPAVKYGISRLLKAKTKATIRKQDQSGKSLREAARNRSSIHTKGETVSKGRRAIVIEPSCSENPAFVPDKNADFDSQASSFSALGLRDDVLKALDSVKVTQPTVIQMVTIPQILKRNHVLCAAQTGSGKTLAYLAPIVHHLREEEEKHGLISRVKRPRACVVVPARELAVQVLQAAKTLCHHARFRSVGIIGGRKKKLMKNGLQSAVDLVVGTPGTLLKFRQKGHLFFSDLSYLVIDEADTMFDHTFKSLTEELLKSIRIRDEDAPASDQLPVDTQVIIVGATLPREILVNTLRDMLPSLQVCTSGLHRVLPHIRHKFEKLKFQDKTARLLRLLKKDLKVPGRRVVVFCNTVTSCDFVSHLFTDSSISFIRLHGNIPPKERSDLFEEFQQRKMDILVCTDIASRGLDTIDVSHVINFDFPTSLADYIHRSGRTGRVGDVARENEVPVATSFISHNRDVRMARVIEEAAKKQKSLENIQVRPKPLSSSPEKPKPEDEMAANDQMRTEEKLKRSSLT